MEEGGLFRDEKPETWVELYQPHYVEKLRAASVARDAEPWGGVKQTPVIRHASAIFDDASLTCLVGSFIWIDQGSKL